MASKNDKLREWAGHLFINEGYTKKAIAEYLGVSEPTIIKWGKEDKWDEEKQRILASPRKLKATLLEALEKISKGEASNIDADALSKISKVLDSLEDKLSIQVFHSAFKEFDSWMTEEDPQLAVKFIAFHKKFLIHKINADG